LGGWRSDEEDEDETKKKHIMETHTERERERPGHYCTASLLPVCSIYNGCRHYPLHTHMPTTIDFRERERGHVYCSDCLFRERERGMREMRDVASNWQWHICKRPVYCS